MKRYFCNTTSILALLGILLTISCSKSGSQSRGRSKEESIGKVQRADVIQRITVSGWVTPNMKADATPSYSGYVRRIYVKLGQSVKARQPLVLVTPTLTDDTAYPLLAPFSGTVTQITRLEGEYIDRTNAGSPASVLRVDDLTKLFLVTDVAEIDYAKIHENQEVILRVPAIADRVYQGKVRDIALSAGVRDDSNRSQEKTEFRVKIEITNPDADLRPGMTAMGDIIPEKRLQVLAVGHEYVYDEGETHYVVLKDGTRKDIRVGLQSETLIEVLEGVQEGQEIRQVDFLSISPGGS